MSLEENKELVRRSWAAYDSGDEETFRALLTDDWVEWDGAGNSVTLDEVLESMRLQRESFPDKHTEIDIMVAEGDLVVARSTTRATHQGPYLDLEPTGGEVVVYEISIHRIADGKIAETWEQSGPAGFYEQLTGSKAPAQADNMS